MVRSTTISGGPQGAVVVKRATSEDARGLVEEARRLEAAAHPGVVELLSSNETADGWELRLAYGGRPVEVAGPLPVAEVAGLVAGVAATLADLHDTGIVHGRIDASHVLIGDGGRAVICGLGVGQPGAMPADDVQALGRLLVTLLGAEVDIEPIPERRWLAHRTWSGWDRRSLLLLADQACAEPPSRRPTARRLAAAIAEAVPRRSSAVLVTGAASASPLLAPERPVVRPPGGAAAERVAGRPRLVALAGALLLVTVLWVAGIGVGRPAARDATPMTAPLLDEVVPSTEAAPRPTHRLPTTTTTAVVEPVRVDGPTMAVGQRRFQVGQAGDLVVVGDWDCAGGPTPAVLRPSTGEVFIFTAWPTDDAVTVRAATRVDGAATPEVEVGPDGCASLVVRHVDGTKAPVTIGRAT